MKRALLPGVLVPLLILAGAAPAWAADPVKNEKAKAERRRARPRPPA